MGNAGWVPRPIPNHLAAVELHGNELSIPRYTDLAICYPFSDTVYYLPPLSLAPIPGSYMSGQMLYLRTYTAFSITITPAPGDTIMGDPSLEMPGGNLLVLAYLSGNDWTVLANIAGGPVMTPEALAKLRASHSSGGRSSPTLGNASPITGSASTGSSVSRESSRGISDSREIPREAGSPSAVEPSTTGSSTAALATGSQTAGDSGPSAETEPKSRPMTKVNILRR